MTNIQGQMDLLPWPQLGFHRLHNWNMFVVLEVGSDYFDELTIQWDFAETPKKLYWPQWFQGYDPRSQRDHMLA